MILFLIAYFTSSAVLRIKLGLHSIADLANYAYTHGMIYKPDKGDKGPASRKHDI